MPVALPPFGFPWAMLDRDVRHTGHSSTVGPDDPSVLGPPWPYKTNGPIASAPAIDYAGTAYVGSEDGWLHAVGFNGKGVPLYKTGRPIKVSPALIEESVRLEGQSIVPPLIYFGSDDGQIYSILPNGKLRWALKPGSRPNLSPVRSSPVVAPLSAALNRVYVGADNGQLYAIFEISPTSAMTAWEIRTAPPLRTSPALSPLGDRLYVGASDGKLYCLDAFSGIPLMNTPVNIGGGPLTTPAVDTASNVYVANAIGTLFAFDAAGGSIWQVSLGNSISAPPTLGKSGEVLVIADDILYAVSAAGAVLWSQAFPQHSLRTAAPVVDSAGTAYVASTDGWVFGVRRYPSAAGSRISWAVQVDPAGPTLTTPTLDAYGRVYIGASDNQLYVIDEVPAFQIAFHSDLSALPNIDVHSLRETYGVLDPARTLRLTSDPSADQQPAYSLDRSVMAYVSDRGGSKDAFLATAIATDEENLTGPGSPFPPTSTEIEPAFTPIDDLTGVSRPPHPRPYLAVTSNASGLNRLVFIDLEAQASGAILSQPFTAWAASLGVPGIITAKLEPANTEQSQIAFAPDGKKIAWRHCVPVQRTGEVRLLILQGSVWQLTGIGPKYYYDPESPQQNRCGDEPCFSPDSHWLAVREGPSLAIYDVFGLQAPVFSTPQSPVGDPTHPNWAPDGSEIAVGLNTGTAADLFVASGSGYGTFSRLTSSRTSDEPYYHYFKMPSPQAQRLDPDRQFPGATIKILGRGFDILHPQNNKVLFTDTQRGPLREARVLSATVNPYEGLGVLSVRVPDFAGHGPITVETRFGSSTTADFHVLPQPVRIVQPRSVPGAKVRVFGLGFDLSPATHNTVSFTAAAGGVVASSALSGGLDGAEEFLVVQVPAGIAESGPIRVDNSYGGAPCTCVFTQLHPAVTFTRTVDSGPTTGLPGYALQGSDGVQVRIEGKDFPFDPYPPFSYGASIANLDVLATGAPPILSIRTVGFIQDGPDTAKFGPDTFLFPSLGPTHPGGNLTIRVSDANLPVSTTSAPFRVPLRNIPIIFVPGTSGSSLDIAAGTPLPVTHTQPLETFIPWPAPASLGSAHRFDWLCKTCPIGSPFGPIVHLPHLFAYDPATASLGHPADPRGPRVWIGTEGIVNILGGTPLGNQGNHYLDALAFNTLGVPIHPEIVPGTVFYDVTSGGDVYKPLIDFLTRPNTVLGWPGRPLCNGLNPTTPTTGSETCFDVSSGSNGATMSGSNAVYLFNLDWRDSIPTQAQRLNMFIDNVLRRPDVVAAGVTKVVLITHSYGGPVARAYYLDPANGATQKIDQVISFGGGFLGVVEPFDILERGSTWGHGIGLGPVSGGFAEWETKTLAQNWPTAYFQMPNSEDWFFDHGSTSPNGFGTTSGGKKVNRAYIRDHRPVIGAGEITSYTASMDWVASRHNSPGTPGAPGGLSGIQKTFFNPPGGSPLGLGDFRSGTGPIYHHRIIGKGLTDTIVATVITLLPSVAAANPPLFLGAVSPPAEFVPTEWSWAVHGDGDSTIPYHGSLGRTLSSDDRVFILDHSTTAQGAKHGDLTNIPEVLGATNVSPPFKGLLQLFLEGAICSQPQMPTPWLSQNDVTEIM